MAEPEIKKKSRKGFASLTKERMSEIARKGGVQAHKNRRAHEWTSEEARASGKRGGKKILEDRGVDYFKELGRRGGLARARARRILKELREAKP